MADFLGYEIKWDMVNQAQSIMTSVIHLFPGDLMCPILFISARRKQVQMQMENVALICR